MAPCATRNVAAAQDRFKRGDTNATADQTRHNCPGKGLIPFALCDKRTLDSMIVTVQHRAGSTTLFSPPVCLQHAFLPVPASSSTLSLEDLMRLMDEVPVMLACFDAATHRCLYANVHYARLGGLAPEQAVGRTAEEIIGQEATERIRPAVERVLAERTTVTYSRSIDTDGQRRWIEVSLVPWGAPQPERLFVMITDITKHRAAEVASKQSNDRLAKFMAASVEGIAFHVGGVITDVNPPLLRLLGYDSDQMTGRRTIDFVPPSEHARVRQVMSSGAELSYESLALHRDGHAIPVEYIVRDMDWAGQRQRMIVVRDLTESRAAQDRIRFLAVHDALTGLPNRVHLDEHLCEMIEMSGPERTPFAVLFLDLDQLKRVNDSLGHASGDEVLIAVAEKLSAFCAARSPLDHEAWLARHGGDEFVMTYRAADRTQLVDFVDSVRRVFETPTQVGTRSFRVTASIGVAIYPEDGETPSQLLKNADAAMYLAKTAGRDAARYFDRAIARAADHALLIEEALGPAIDNGEFELYFQPELSADGKRLVCVEALLRWNRGGLGLLTPDEFIPVAESLHQIIPLGQWVLDSAMTQLVRWRTAGWHDARVAVNLSSNQFRSPDFVDSVLAALQRHGLTGASLELELTERMVMGHDPAMQVALTRLRDAGITLAIDDFGTGFSSLSRLRTLPVETLKIDQSFVRELPASASSVAIVNTIIELAHGLAMTAVAEGVETTEQRQCLESLGCRVMQGFLFARPMPAAEFDRWLQTLLGR